ncbi:hypothetical protein GN956_G13166 [Arapaima gigas]
MLSAVTNRTGDFWHEGNNDTSQRPVPEQPWVFATVGRTSDSKPLPGIPNTESPVESSGIVPGLIAAALFIAFLLALYAMLWKCMVSQHNRKGAMRRVKMRRRPDLAC